MGDEKKHDPPKQSAGDLVHSTVRAAVSLVPGGSVVLEFFNNVIRPPMERRRDEWMASASQAIEELKARKGIRDEDLQANESFVSAVAQASAIAVKNHEREKLDALRNAVLNSALPDAPDDSLKQIFLGWVDRLTVWHLRILDFFNEPRLWFELRGRGFSPGMGSPARVLTAAYSELSGRRDFVDLIVKDLWNGGLISTDGIHVTMSAGGTVASRTTETGKQFLAFIAAPK